MTLIIAVVIGGLCLLVGFFTATWLEPIDIDEGIAALLGSTIGAGVTVAGAFAVAYRSEAARARAEANLLRSNIQYIRDRCSEIIAMAQGRGEDDDFQTEGEQLGVAARALLHSINHLEQMSPFSEIKNYSYRAKLHSYLEQLSRPKATIEKETKWLGSKVTKPIVDNSFTDLAGAAEAVLETTNVLDLD